MKATWAVAALFALTACARPSGPLVAGPERPPEHRWPTQIDSKLCPDEDAAKARSAACQSIREPYTVLRRSDRRDLIAYQVRTDSGKTGWIEFLDYDAGSESESSHKYRLERAAAEKTAKADCARRGGVSIGMTQGQVYASCWGNPQRINRTLTSGADHEQLVYPGYNYVYLRNGVVTSIQTHR